MTKGLSKYLRAIGICWFISVQMYSTRTFAEDDLSIVRYIPNYLSVDLGLDNDHGRNRFVQANLGLTLKDRIIIGVGKEEETVARSEENLDNKTYLLGYNYLPFTQNQIEIEYEFWGDTSKISIDSYRIMLAYYPGEFSLSVTPEFRKIKINNDSQCDDAIDSGAVKIGFSVDVKEDFTFSTSYVSYDYSNNLTELGECVSNSEQLEIESRIDSVANDSEIRVGLDYYDDTETYGVSFSKSKTALFSKTSKTVYLFASTDRYDDWSLSLTTGATRNTDDSSTLFATGTITYFW